MSDRLESGINIQPVNHYIVVETLHVKRNISEGDEHFILGSDLEFYEGIRR